MISLYRSHDWSVHMDNMMHNKYTDHSMYKSHGTILHCMQMQSRAHDCVTHTFNICTEPRCTLYNPGVPCITQVYPVQNPGEPCTEPTCTPYRTYMYPVQNLHVPRTEPTCALYRTQVYPVQNPGVPCTIYSLF